MAQNKLLFYISVFLLAIFVSLYATRSNLGIQNLGFLIFFLIFIPTLLKPEIGFIIIIVSVLFSPDLILGVTTRREVTLRIEDLFLLIVLLASLLRQIRKDAFKLFRTKYTKLFAAYIGVCVISTIVAMMFNQPVDAKHAFFSLLKYAEYFLLFLLVKINLKSIGQVKIFVAVFCLTALAASFVAHRYIEQQERQGKQFFRVAGPVEKERRSEPGSFGGYLVFMMGIAAGLLINSRRTGTRLFLLFLLFLMFKAFLYTLSRGSYLALIFMMIAIPLFSRKITIIYALAIFVFISIIFSPNMIRKRVMETISVRQGVSGEYLEFEESPRIRLESWQMVLFQRLPASPIFGHGLGRFFIDSQIFLTLSEVGLLGLFFLINILVKVFRDSLAVYRNKLIQDDNFCRGIVMGFILGFIALIGQSISTNTFIIIRIMEVFWFFAAMVISLPGLISEPAEEGKDILIAA